LELRVGIDCFSFIAMAKRFLDAKVFVFKVTPQKVLAFSHNGHSRHRVNQF